MPKYHLVIIGGQSAFYVGSSFPFCALSFWADLALVWIFSCSPVISLWLSFPLFPREGRQETLLKHQLEPVRPGPLGREKTLVNLTFFQAEQIDRWKPEGGGS